LSSAQVASELARTKVEFIPSIRQVIEKDGSIRFEQADPIEVSLLDLGLQPTFYSFSEATVEVTMDLKVVEETTTTGGAQLRSKALFASTRSLRTERKLNRDVKVSSKMSAKLVPVPAPPLLGPLREVEDLRDGGGV
ncbi:MAG: hypothetical protein KIT83_20685, partial [Bryobacterales bacterium]|nr:hypothetical protein [Bryobacterales bacterium]